MASCCTTILGCYAWLLDSQQPTGGALTIRDGRGGEPHAVLSSPRVAAYVCAVHKLSQGPCPPLPPPGGSSTIDVHAAFVLCIKNTPSPCWLCTRRWDYHDRPIVWQLSK